MLLLTQFEKTLEPVFKGLPQLSKGGKDWLVKAWPVLALVLGVLQILAASSLWHLGHTTNQLVDYANQWSHMYGMQEAVHHLSLFYWLGLISLLVDGAILLVAYNGLRSRSKRRGWDLLFLGATLNLLYGIFIAFDSSYDGAGKFIGTFIGSTVGFYLLFQIRDSYSDKKSTRGAVK